MSLLAVAVWDTPENGRSALTRRTMHSLFQTVNWNRHRLFVVDNGSTDPATIRMLARMSPDCPAYYPDPAGDGRSLDTIPPATVIRNGENLGTARAINRAWQHRRPGEAAAKLDNDVEFHEAGWADRLEECVARDQQLGIVGLKRDDLWEHPAHENPWFRSELRMLPHKPGERWLAVEKCHHVMGTCVLHSSALLDKVGFLCQFGKYGLDDSTMAVRCHVAGFYSAFYCNCRIAHIDPGGTPYQEWKERESGKRMDAYHTVCRQYVSGERSVYHGPDDDLDREFFKEGV